jgi:tetratricopeptide (TPR) repeat protein
VDPASGIRGSVAGAVFVIALWNLEPDKEESRLSLMKTRLESSVRARISMGVARFPFLDFTRKETFHNALKALDHAAFFGPDSQVSFDDVSLNISGDRLYETGNPREAALEYVRGLSINPGNINLINSLGVCYGVMNRMDKALETFRKAISMDGEDVMALYNAGLASNLLGDLDAAVDLLQKASRINPAIFEVELTTGSLLLSNGQVEQAVIHLDRAARLNPLSSAPPRLLGDHYLELRQPDSAIPEYNKAIKQNPSDAQALSGLARAFLLQNRNLDIALTLAREAVSLSPDNPDQKKQAEAEFDLAERLGAADAPGSAGGASAPKNPGRPRPVHRSL